ncbi:MAG TPA: sugar transferase [Bacteroidota bacterium]|nr:sugar transferase [Candidatus Kapabacteria bacterium]HRS01454.1 sugar transferase [Bacteroidota bacterium]
MKRINSIGIQIFFQIISDFLAISLSFFIQYWFRFHSGFIPIYIVPDFSTTIITYLLFLVYWYIILFFSGMYKNWYEISPFEEITTILKAVLFGTLLLIFLIYFDSENSPRMLFLLYMVVFSLSLIIFRMLNRQLQKTLRIKGKIKIPSALIGDITNSYEMFKNVSSQKNWGFDLQSILIFDDNFKNDSGLENNEMDDVVRQNINNLPIEIIYDCKNYEQILDPRKIEAVLLTKSCASPDLLLDIATKATENNIRVKIHPDLYEIFSGQSRTQNLWGIPLMEINTKIFKPWQEIIKRGFDILFSLFVLIIGLPIWIIVGILVKLSSPGPVFYVQKRVGKDGKVFNMYKFRSMYTEKSSDSTWTENNDPRVTKFGRFIRKTHLDEIPQFINTLKGDMSVVGPRPEMVPLVESFSKALPHYRRRLKIRPGITGWWQIKYTTYELSIDEVRNRLKDDFYYIENFSLRLDFEIILRTIWLIFKGHGQT